MADNPVKTLLAKASQLDARRQRQVDNQRASIGRLLEDPSAEAELATVNSELAVAQANYDKALEYLFKMGIDQDFEQWKQRTA